MVFTKRLLIDLHFLILQIKIKGSSSKEGVAGAMFVGVCDGTVGSDLGTC